MPKCLNCGKEVKNKFCNTSCQNQYRSKIMQEEYNKNPNLCACCNTPLTWEQRRNKYCSSSCAAKVNNIGVNRHLNHIPESNECESTSKMNKIRKLTDDEIVAKFRDTIKTYQCSDEEFISYIQNFSSWKELYEQLGYSQSRSGIKKQIFRRCDELGLKYPELKDKELSIQTKEQVFDNHKNWQSARSNIRRHAQKIFMRSGIKQECLLCGYNKYIEVAHIKAVSDFDDSATVAEINDLHNLVPLCPNHHWEFDHDCLSEENLKKINDYCNKL